MGIWKEFVKLYENPRLPDSLKKKYYNELGDAKWGQGEYRKALRAWHAAFLLSASIHDMQYFPSLSQADEASVNNAARYAEHRGAVLWIRGQYLRGFFHLRRAFAQYVLGDSSVHFRLRAELAETYGRLLIDMRRSPDTRLLMTRKYTDSVRQRIMDIHQDSQKRQGLRLGNRLGSVTKLLSEAKDDDAPQRVVAFDESEALHAALNYQRHLFRQNTPEIRLMWRSLISGNYPGVTQENRKSVKKEIKVLLYSHQRIGAQSDAARVVLLHQACTCFAFLSDWKAFRDINISLWHRIRIGLRFDILRAAWIIQTRHMDLE